MRGLFCVALLLFPCVLSAEIASTKYAGDAANITTGTLDTERLSVGTDSGTVAAGDDVRFETISVGNPDVDPGDGRALIWIE